MLKRFLSWLFGLSSIARLEAHASEYGTLSLQQVEGPSSLYWQVSLRARQNGGAPRYAWSAQGDTLPLAIAAVLAEAKDSGAMQPIKGGSFRPRLGGAEFDE